jgi:hypothetical protein
MLGCLLFVIVGIPAIVAGMVGVFKTDPISFFQERVSPLQLPTECGIADKVVIRGRTLRLDEPLVTGNISCEIRIIDSELTAPVIVKDGLNVKVKVENSVLRVSKAVMQGGSGAKLELTKGSKVFTDQEVIQGESNSELVLSHSTIESKGGVTKGSHANVQLSDKSRITTQKPIIDGDHGTITLEDSSLVLRSSAINQGASHFRVQLSNQSTVQSENTAILGGTHGTIRVSASKIIGKERAIDIGTHGTLHFEDGGIVQGSKDAVRTESHANIEVQDKSKVQAAKTGIIVGDHSRIRVNDGAVSGSVGIMGGDYVTVLLRSATIRGGTKVQGRYSKVQEE